MSNSTSKKRKESPNSSSKDVKEGGDMDQPSWMTKKHVTSSQGSGEEVGDDHADQVPARTPLKVSLKRHGKREHEGIERPFRDSADAETNAEEAMQIGPPPQKQSYPPNTFSANFNGDRLSENTQPSLFLEEGLENPSKSATNVTSQASYQLHPTQSPKVPIVSLPSTTPSMTITTYLGGENAGAIGSGGVSSTARPGVHAPRERQPQQGGLYLSSGERGGVAFHANGTGSGVGSSGQASSLSVGSSLLASSSCNAFAATSTTTTSAATTTNNNMATNLRASLRSTNGGIGQKQVKKLIIKSALGTSDSARWQQKLISFAQICGLFCHGIWHIQEKMELVCMLSSPLKLVETRINPHTQSAPPRALEGADFLATSALLPNFLSLLPLVILLTSAFVL